MPPSGRESNRRRLHRNRRPTPNNAYFTADDVFHSLSTLSGAKNVGPDGLLGVFLFHLRSIIAYPLFLLFRRSLDEGIFPSILQLSSVTPVHKSGINHFSDLCRSVDFDPWGLPYKVVTKRIGRRRPGIEARGMESEIADHLFPNPPATDWALEPHPPETAEDETVEDFTLAELAQACKRLPPDVKNAFNTAPWKKVDNALRAKNVPSYLVKMIRSYLQDRSILVGETLHRRSTTCGVPQGSVLGPALWNVFYDDLLDMETPLGVQLVAFADDVCVIGIARTGEASATLLNPVLAKVSAWMEQNGLKLAPTKTEAVVLTRKNKYDNPELLVEGHVIPIKQSMRYLGVEIDTRLSFTKHIQQASRKATDSATAIARLMPNIGGPSQSKRALLGTVANSKMLYASPTWAVRGTKTAKNRAELARAQRTVALRITRAYRTVSGDASSVLASMLPADMLATERARVRVRLDDQTDVAPSTVKNQERIISIAA
ncbi:hypothetical protein QTP88_018366 [Uroleucon formosanum]